MRMGRMWGGVVTGIEMVDERGGGWNGGRK